MAQIGAGGMGVVYRAEHRLMERPVALKVISPRLLENTEAVERFHTEVKAAAKLLHPNIVAAHDAEQAGSIHFLVMEFVDGTSLARVVEKRGALPAQFACNYVRQAALGLQHAHDRGMVHRDIKPQNLMLTRKGQVKVLDFGLARLAREREQQASPAIGPQTTSLTNVGTVLGTPDYIAPEQVSDARKADIRSDIYSLGCTLYFLLTGRVPFPGGTSLEKMMQHALESPTSLAQMRPELSPELIAIVEKMMAKLPGERYQKPADVAEALLPFARSVQPDGKEAQLAIATLLPEPSEQGFASLQQGSVEPPRRQRSKQRFRPKRESFLGRQGRQLVVVGAILLLLSGAAAVFVKYVLPHLQDAKAHRHENADAKVDAASPATPSPGTTRADRSGKSSSTSAAKPERPAPVASKRAVIVLASQGFYYPDYEPIHRRLREAGVSITIAASRAGTARPMQSGTAYPTVEATHGLAELRADDYDLVAFCGGVGVLSEYCRGGTQHEAARRFIHDMLAQKKPVTALCGGPAVLADAGVLQGKQAVCYPLDGERYKRHLDAGGANWTDVPVVHDGLLITGRGPEDAEQFAAAIVERLRTGK
jgi:serine/threonine-protein kinase